MYSQPISTTIGIHGLVVYVTYFVTPEGAVEWHLDDDYYDEDDFSPELVELCEFLMRAYVKDICKVLGEEFKARMYHEEESAAALAEQQDVF